MGSAPPTGAAGRRLPEKWFACLSYNAPIWLHRGNYTIFGFSLGRFIAAMGVVIVGFLADGPVGRFKLEATHDGALIEADSEARQ
jgi:hypothetical protein